MLFLAKFEWRDGESEYESCKGIVADNIDKAHQKAESFLSDYWGEETVIEDGLYMPRCGFPAVKVSSITEIRDMLDVLRGVGMTDAEGDKFTMRR